MAQTEHIFDNRYNLYQNFSEPCNPSKDQLKSLTNKKSGRCIFLRFLVLSVTHLMKTNKRIAQYLVFRIRLLLLIFTVPSKVSHRIIIVEIHYIGSLMTKAIVRNIAFLYVRLITGFPAD